MKMIKASTEIYGILGYPAKHSLSPVIQNGWMGDFGFDAVYVGFEVVPNDFPAALSGLQKVGLRGGNITAPLKEDIAKMVAFPSDEVKAIGAANTIRAQDNDFAAINTDGLGLIADLDFHFNGWSAACNIITIIGAGGAARGALKALLANNPTEIRFVGRSKERLAVLANIGAILAQDQKIAFNVYGWDEMKSALEGADLVINATTLGLKGIGSLTPDLSLTARDAIIYDMVYMPNPTDFTVSAQAQKRRALNGLGMLVGQGAAAFEYWFGVRPDFTLGLARLKTHLNTQINESKN